MLRISLVLGLVSGVFAANAQEPWVYRENPNWDRSWNDRPAPRVGACFYKDQGFRGDHFCVRRGDRLPALPGNFGDNISSIQLFGRTRVVIFNDRDFRNGSQELRRSVGDLRNERFRGGHTWNDRISSVIVE